MTLILHFIPHFISHSYLLFYKSEICILYARWTLPA